MFFLQDIDPLFRLIENKRSVMYNKRDFNLFEIFSSRREDCIENIQTKDKKFVLSNELSIPFDCPCYESGILGINYLLHDRISDIRTCSKLLYKKLLLENSEEIAFGYHLKKESIIYLGNKHVSHYSNQDYIRYFIAHTLKIDLDNDESKLSEFLSYFHLNKTFFERACPSYEDIPYFSFIFHLYIHHQKLSFDNIMINAYNNPSLAKTSAGRMKLYKIAVNFQHLPSYGGDTPR